MRILYVLHTGIQWEHFPQELGFGSGMTCWRQLRDWNEAGVWQQLHEVLLAELNAAARLYWSRCVVDSSHVRALKGGSTRGRRRSIEGRPVLETPRDHRRPRHPARRPANRRQPQRRHSAPAAARRRPAGARQGRTSPPQARLPVRRGYDHDGDRDQGRARGIVPAIARRGTLHGPAWVPTGGWSSEPSAGYMASASTRIRWEEQPTSTRLSSSLPAA